MKRAQKLASRMGNYRLSHVARGQVKNIFSYGLKTFGAYQAKAYHAGLERTFGLIADFPLMGPTANFLKVGLRRFRFQAHFVYYTVEADHVLIQAILPQRVNVKPDLFE